MKFVADENCDRIIVADLRAAGFDVTSIRELAPSTSDPEIFVRAAHEGRILLTNDHDFGLLAERMKKRPPAIVLMRLDPLTSSLRSRIVVEAMRNIGGGMAGHFIVLDPHQVRSRPYKD